MLSCVRYFLVAGQYEQAKVCGLVLLCRMNVPVKSFLFGVFSLICSMVNFLLKSLTS